MSLWRPWSTGVRPLTGGEVAMTRQLFGTGIDYMQVRVHRRRRLPGMGDNAVAPFGAIYFPSHGYRDDFSAAGRAAKVWFMHEMTHVWQYQRGLCVLCHGLLLGLQGGYGTKARAYGYDHVRDQGKTLGDFNLEQQGELIAHYFDACHLSSGDKVHARRRSLLPFYEAVLADFLKDPLDARTLPRTVHVPR